MIGEVYHSLVADGVITEQERTPPPTVPMDYSWARELGLIRKPASFMSSICDERGQELLYAGIPISDVSLPEEKHYTLAEIQAILCIFEANLWEITNNCSWKFIQFFVTSCKFSLA